MLEEALKRLSDSESGGSGPFADFEEEAIVSIALDMPDYFMSISNVVDPGLFTRPHTGYVMMHIMEYIKKFQLMPTRRGLLNAVRKDLTADHDGWKDIVGIVERPTDPRELPAVKEVLHDWAKRKTFGLLYAQEAQDAYARGDYDQLQEIVDNANKISNVSSKGFWFYEQFEELYREENNLHYKTGYPQLNKILNDGGPGPGEVLCWMAPTGVGKSIALCNDAIYQTQVGVDTLFVTFELDAFKTAARCCGALTNVGLKDFKNHRGMISDKIRKTYQAHNAKLAIWDLPPDECSVDDIYAIVRNLEKTKGWRPKCIVIDYLELMRGRRESDNKDDYSRQKNVATQIRGLAKNEGVLIYTATQTNRAGNDTDKKIDITNVAESYGKTMPLDYIISLNQTEAQRKSGHIDMYVVKNRNGPKFETIECKINYSTMGLIEKPF